MNFIKTAIDDLMIIEPQILGDQRGFFYESYRRDVFAQNGIEANFVQNNVSRSTKDVLRGFHLQLPPYTQDKLVWVNHGAVLDVAVDGRPNSDTFGQWESVELSAANHKLFFIPKGFFHGFLVLSDEVDFEYMCSNYYRQDSELGIIWNDPDIGIAWPKINPVLSTKDSLLPLLKDIKLLLPSTYET